MKSHLAFAPWRSKEGLNENLELGSLTSDNLRPEHTLSWMCERPSERRLRLAALARAGRKRHFQGNWLEPQGVGSRLKCDMGKRYRSRLYSGIAIKGNYLYAYGCSKRKNTISCMHAKTGRIIWKYSYECLEYTQATPAVDGEGVYVLSKDGVLFSLNASNGKLQWRKDLVSEYGAVKPFYGFAGSPIIVGDLLVLNVNTSGMGLEKNTGRLIWTSEPPPVDEIMMRIGMGNGATYMTPVVYKRDGKVFALIYSWKGLFSIDVQNGIPIWHYPWENYNECRTPDPVIYRDYILLADDSVEGIYKRFSTLLRINTEGPKVVWKSFDLFSDVCSPVVIAGYIYGVYGGTYSSSKFSSLRCLDLESGKMVWEHHPLEEVSRRWISLSAADGKLIVLEDSGKLAIVEATPSGYREISSCILPLGGDFTPPILSNGRIYCRRLGGTLVCLDVSK